MFPTTLNSILHHTFFTSLNPILKPILNPAPAEGCDEGKVKDRVKGCGEHAPRTPDLVDFVRLLVRLVEEHVPHPPQLLSSHPLSLSSLSLTSRFPHPSTVSLALHCNPNPILDPIPSP